MSALPTGHEIVEVDGDHGTVPETLLRWSIASRERLFR